MPVIVECYVIGNCPNEIIDSASVAPGRLRRMEDALPVGVMVHCESSGNQGTVTVKYPDRVRVKVFAGLTDYEGRRIKSNRPIQLRGDEELIIWPKENFSTETVVYLEQTGGTDRMSIPDAGVLSGT